jgi:DNA mismatch repair protein MutL
MKHPYFHKAVISAYDRLIPEGMQIPYFLYFEVEPSEIDVNIHPTKTEIKFENEQAIWQILSASVRDAIGKFCEVPTIEFDTQGRPEIPVFDPTHDDIAAPRVHYNPDYNPFKNAGTSGMTPQREATQQSFFDEEQVSSQPQSPTEILSEKSPAHYQYKGKYLMTAVKSGLMIIDQHRADIRIRYERYIKDLNNHTANTQKLLFPETVTFSPSDAVVLEQVMADMADIGFDLSDLGGHTFAINGVPAGIEGLDPVQLIRQMVTDAQNPIESLNSQVALSLARSAAIPYGQILNNEEMECIINELFSCSNVNYTPDGKAILCILPQGDIEQLLG